ncbi:glycosyltransferase [Amylibacter sp.]|nr:glycosyltransferase [Amylibacter sp.]
MKIAVIHDWLVTVGGAEHTLEQILRCYPSADVFCVINFLNSKNSKFLKNHNVKTSFIQKIPFAKKIYRKLLPLMPIAIEQFNLSDYDLIISSCHAVSKGVLTGPNQIHISYTYSPCRYAWDLQHQYLDEVSNTFLGKILNPGMRYMLHKFRIWDSRTSNSVDHFLVISKFIGSRVKKIYRRNSTVVYPPVNTQRFKLHKEKQDYYFIASRMVPYKKIPLIVEAFTYMPNRKLVVIGDGPDLKKCKNLAGSNVEILGFQSREVVVEYVSKAKAFLFMAIEDFGIAPLEAQACGTPVIAYSGGALPETIRGLNESRPTGVLFEDQTITGLISAIESFEKNRDKIKPEWCSENAHRFSENIFRDNLIKFVAKRMDHFE